MHDILFTIVSSYAQIFLISFVVWMGILLVLMFREMFSPDELVLRAYLRKVWQALLVSFEVVAYISTVTYLIMMLVTKKYVDYAISTLAAFLLSSIYLSVRKKTFGFYFRKRKETTKQE